MKKFALLLIVLIFSSVCYAQCVAKGRMVAEVIDNQIVISLEKQSNNYNEVLATAKPNTSVGYSTESTNEGNKKISKSVISNSDGKIKIKIDKRFNKVVVNYN